MRVTHVITRLVVGGAQENTIASVLGLHARPDVHVDLISGPTTGPEGSLESQLIAPAAGRRISPGHRPAAARSNVGPSVPGARLNDASCSTGPLLTVLPSLVRPVHPWCDLRAWQQLTRQFRATRPDIVHTHSGKAGVLGRLAAARAGVPIIIHTIHGPSFGSFQGALANYVFRAAERCAARVTTHFVTVADAMRDQYLAAGIGGRDQYTRIFSGFSLDPFLRAANDPADRARLGLSPDDFVVGKIARLFQLKGHDDLLAVAPELVRAIPRIKFLLVGDGEWRGRLERRAHELGLARQVVFTGLVPPADVAGLVGIMDAVVHLSLREGLPRALPQALAAGKPVIAYDCDGAREVCLDNETGFLLRPGHMNRLKEAIGQLAADARLRQRLGKRGREFVREHFAVEHMVEQIHALYLRLMRRAGIAPTEG